MITWLLGFWYARCRRLDMEILWPTCVRMSPDLDMAKAVFACHAYNDPAWMVLGEDAIYRFIDSLTPG